ncbi:MAG TPA: hypothetical protein VH740_07535 [Vicinamibacterales bacterium]
MNSESLPSPAEATEKLQSLLKGLEAREQHAKRRAAIITLVPVAAMLLFAAFMSWLIAGQARELTSTTKTLDEKKLELRTRDDELAAKTRAVEEKERELARVQSQIDAAFAKLGTTDGRPPSAQAVESALDDVIQAKSAAVAEARPGPIKSAGRDPARREAIEQLFDRNAAVRVAAYGQLLPRYRNDPSLVVEVLQAADGKQGNANGIYNALVVLSHMNADALKPHANAVRAFAEKSRSIGPRVSARATTLIERTKN